MKWNKRLDDQLLAAQRREAEANARVEAHMKTWRAEQAALGEALFAKLLEDPDNEDLQNEFCGFCEMDDENGPCQFKGRGCDICWYEEECFQ